MPACIAVATSGAKQTLLMRKRKAGKNAAGAEKRQVAMICSLNTELVFECCVCLYHET